MIIIYIENQEYSTVKNWDTALHECANQYKNGVPLNKMKIINEKTQEELPINIQHLTFFHK